jgi:hypothetical protein
MGGQRTFFGAQHARIGLSLDNLIKRRRAADD